MTAFYSCNGFAKYLSAFSKSCAAANSNPAFRKQFHFREIESKKFSGNQNNADDCPCCPYKNENIIE
jgi:hypothetical protein